MFDPRECVTTRRWLNAAVLAGYALAALAGLSGALHQDRAGPSARPLPAALQSAEPWPVRIAEVR